MARRMFGSGEKRSGSRCVTRTLLGRASPIHGDRGCELKSTTALAISVAIALLQLSGLAMSQPTPAQPATGTSVPSADAPIAVSVRLGHTVLPPTATVAALRAAVEQSNARMRLPGLADELNPEVVDVDKALAVVAAVPALVKKSPKRMARLELNLRDAGLRASSADPTTIASFSKPFKLEIVEIKGESPEFHTTVPVVLQLARERATRAKRQLVTENARIEQLEAIRSSTPDGSAQRLAVRDELTPALWRRSALVRVWSANAELLREQPAADAAAKADADAAGKALNAYVLPGRGGMPGSR
jgi:hypothetical protein